MGGCVCVWVGVTVDGLIFLSHSLSFSVYVCVIMFVCVCLTVRVRVFCVLVWEAKITERYALVSSDVRMVSQPINQSLSRSAKSHKMAAGQDQLIATASKSNRAAALSRVHRNQYIHGDSLDTATLLDSKDIQPNKCHWKYWRTDIVSWTLSNTIQPGCWKYSSMSCFRGKFNFAWFYVKGRKSNEDKRRRGIHSFLRLNHFEKRSTMLGKCE